MSGDARHTRICWIPALELTHCHTACRHFITWPCPDQMCRSNERALPCQCADFIRCVEWTQQESILPLLNPFPANHFRRERFLIEGNFPVFQVCLAHWNNKCLQLFWIYWAGIEEVFRYPVWLQPHYRWKSKSQKQNTNRKKSLTLNMSVTSRTPLPHVQASSESWCGWFRCCCRCCTVIIFWKTAQGSKMCHCGYDEYFTSTKWFWRLCSKKALALSVYF